MPSESVTQKHPGHSEAAGFHSAEGLSDEERELVYEVVRAVRSIRFGSVGLTIHEGKLVEIQKIEKIRRKNPA
jgi:hypothetical protein